MNLNNQVICNGVSTAIKERVDTIIKEESDKASAIVKKRIAEVAGEVAVHVSCIDEFQTMSTRILITLQVGDTKVDL